MEDLGILRINIKSKTSIIDKIYGIDYTHIGVYYRASNENQIYIIKYEPLFSPFVPNVNNIVYTLNKIMEMDNIKQIKYAKLNTKKKCNYIYNIIKSCVNNNDVNVIDTIKNIYEEYDYKNDIFSDDVILENNSKEKTDDSMKSDILNLEINTINSLRESIYNAYTNKYIENKNDIIASIYDPDNNPDKILMDLSKYVCNLINLLNNALNNDNNIKISEYNNVIEDIKKIIVKINRKYVCITKCNNIINLNKKTNHIIKFYDDYDNILFEIYKNLHYIKKKIDNNNTPIININKFIDYYNSLLYFSGNKKLKIDRCTIKYSLNGIIIPSYEYIRNKNIMVPLNNNEIIISAINPNLDMFNDDELKEILITLETYANGDPIFDELRSKITGLLSKKYS